jgi:hypothetical protein
MSYRIYTTGNMVAVYDTTNADRQSIEKFSKGELWYEYDPTASPILYRLHYGNPERAIFFEEKGVQYTEIQDSQGNGFASDALLQEYLDQILGKGTNYVSRDNSTTTLLTGSNAFTGVWEDVSNYDSVIVAVKTDQDGSYQVQFSPDSTNIDSSLTRYYRTSQIEPPHRFTITRRFCRVVYTNGGTDQTYLRLQTTFGTKSDLNIPVDSTMSQDYDAISVRGTDYTTEVALGRRQGASTWNKFGYNEDVDTAAPEVVASFGGAFNQRLTNAETLDIVSTSANDTNTAGTGVRQLVIFGVGGTAAGDRNDITEVIALNGTGTVTTTNLFWGVNRMTIFTSGTADSNVGTITATASTSGNTMAEMPATQGTTQQCIFYVPENYQFLATWMYLNVIKSSGGGSPDVDFKAYVYSEVVTAEFEVYRDSIDVSGGSPLNIQLTPGEPFIIGEKSIFWIEAETSSNNTSVRGRFSGKLIRDADA